MADFERTYLGKLRASVGTELLLVPGARIVICNGDGDILLQLRSDFHKWGLPGGMAEPGESLETVIQREVREETGLSITDPIPYGFASDPAHETIEFPNGDRTQFFVMNFYTATFSGALRSDGDETLRLGWFCPADLPDMLDNMRRSVERFLEFRRTGTFQMF